MKPVRASAAAFALLACAGQAPLALPATLPQAALLAPKPAPAASAAALLSSVKSTPVAPAPAATPEALPVSLGDIGASGPVQLLGTSASGAWVALCGGPEKTAKLVLGSGSGEAIDDVLAQAPSGRYVVALRDGAALLIDAVTGTRVNLSELGADVRRVRADYAEHRTLSFDARGQYLAYLRTKAAGSQIVVRTLEDGSEQVVAPGPGDVFRLKLSTDARYVTFDVLRDDTNHNGKLDWPAPEEPPRKGACERPSLPKFRSFAYQGRGDALTHAAIAIATGASRDVPELVTPLGPSLLVREADGSLRLDQAGKRTPLSPASCSGRVLFADAERGLVLATCAPTPPPKKSRAAAPPSGKREVWLFGNGYAKNLQSELYETSTDRDASLGVRLVPLYPGSDASVLDLERREVLPLPPGSRVVASSGALALIWRGSELYRYDALSKTEQPLARGVLKNPELLQAGSSVLLSPFVIIGCEGPALASPARPLALSTSGFVLTAAGGGSGGVPAPVGLPEGAIQGPLHWVDAKVPPPDGPPR
jgi:hypothetical protein